MGQILLTKEELLREYKYPDLVNLRKVRNVAKHQLKKVMTDAPWKIGTGIRFLSEEEYQDLLKEVEE